MSSKGWLTSCESISLSWLIYTGHNNNICHYEPHRGISISTVVIIGNSSSSKIQGGKLGSNNRTVESLSYWVCTHSMHYLCVISMLFRCCFGVLCALYLQYFGVVLCYFGIIWPLLWVFVCVILGLLAFFW